jgi:hypothetical protein
MSNIPLTNNVMQNQMAFNNQTLQFHDDGKGNEDVDAESDE